MARTKSELLPLERHRGILRHLGQHGRATVAELASLCSVSEMTIRRDLAELEESKVVERTHGGAVFVPSMNRELTFDAKESYHRELKDRLASYAANRFVHNNAIVCLEGGTTITGMAPHLGRFSNLTILTNGLRTAAALHDLLPASTVMSSGGTLREVSYTFVGPVADEFFSRFRSEIAFFSAIGLTPEDGYTDANLLESQAKRSMAAAAGRRIALVDSTKLGYRSFTMTFQLDEIDLLITDDQAPADVLEQLRDKGVEVEIAP